MNIFTLSKILEDTEEVLNYISKLLSGSLDEIPLHCIDMYVGRRRFAATLVEQILICGNVSKAITCTTRTLIDDLKVCWNSIIPRSKLTTREINSLLDMSSRLLYAFLVII